VIEKIAAFDWRMVQERVNWLRSLVTDNEVEEVGLALKDGLAEDVLWAAGALAATRYVNNQAHNLLGFVSHALIGLEDARRLSVTQTQRIRHLLLIQALWQVVFDMNDPCLSPYELLPFAPFREKSIGDNIKMLRADVRMGEYMRCDHRLVALEQDLPRESLLDLLMDIGLEGMITDDHTLITPVLCLGLGDLVGWEYQLDMLRCALRYSATFPRNFAPYDRAIQLVKHYELEAGPRIQQFQPERIQALRDALKSAQPSERPEVAARALAGEGYSPQSVLAAVTLTGCDYYLMAEPVPHEDFDAISREVAPMHIGTSTNALRTSLQYMSPRTQVLATIQGGSLMERGPSVLNKDFVFVPFEPCRSYPYAEHVESLSHHSPEALIQALRQALPEHDYSMATAAVRAYAESGAQPEPLIAALTEVACTDNGTILHNVKHLNSMVKEFWACQHPDRWNYLIAAARFMAWYAGVTQDTYRRAVAVLD
jgi:hypothetical protein